MASLGMTRIQAFFSKHVTRPRPHRFVYRLTGGVIGSRLPGVGPPVLLLTVRGRRSGERRTTPVMYFRIDEQLVVAGTNNGEDRDPAWCLNLRSHPDAEVQIGRQTRQVRARIALGPERDRLWAEMTQQHSLFAFYESRTARQIPVVVLATDGS